MPEHYGDINALAEISLVQAEESKMPQNILRKNSFGNLTGVH